MKEAKQVLVVRKDLKMNKGKIAVQCAHASSKVFFDLMKFEKTNSKGHKVYSIPLTKQMEEWKKGAYVKIVVGVDSEKELEDLAISASFHGIPFAMITDAGRTAFNGVPTKTVLAIGPDEGGIIDSITGHLPLL
jgi:PTH2 family peptidyl-tRNA hydrolase